VSVVAPVRVAIASRLSREIDRESSRRPPETGEAGFAVSASLEAAMIDEQMIERPAIRATLLAGDVALARDEQPPLRCLGVPRSSKSKLRSDSRIRREVVGQMLDYAANGRPFGR
jgi:hypothetical protein